MKTLGSIKIGHKHYHKGDFIPWYNVYPFFLFHMLIFGGSGFFLAYGEKNPDATFLYLHGGFAILVYTIFYVTMFGRDEIKWMFINAILGLAGIYTQIGWILSLFGKNHGYSVEEVAGELGLLPKQIQRVYDDIDNKRSTTRYLHLTAQLVGEVGEINS